MCLGRGPKEGICVVSFPGDSLGGDLDCQEETLLKEYLNNDSIVHCHNFCPFYEKEGRHLSHML